MPDTSSPSSSVPRAGDVHISFVLASVHLALEVLHFRFEVAVFIASGLAKSFTLLERSFDVLFPSCPRGTSPFVSMTCRHGCPCWFRLLQVGWYSRRRAPVIRSKSWLIVHVRNRLSCASAHDLLLERLRQQTEIWRANKILRRSRCAQAWRA